MIVVEHLLMLRLYDHPLGPGLTLKKCDKGRESSFENCDTAGLSDLQNVPQCLHCIL